MALSHTLLDRLNAIARELQTTQSVAVENLIQAMETITMSDGGVLSTRSLGQLQT